MSQTKKIQISTHHRTLNVASLARQKQPTSPRHERIKKSPKIGQSERMRNQAKWPWGFKEDSPGFPRKWSDLAPEYQTTTSAAFSELKDLSDTHSMQMESSTKHV